ncbi:MAG TPA: hypothetical protein PK250_12785 [Syntrophobacter fumaroxidans]|nr:hypothetical protein [Syntrophobacter fumaroxidans]
MPMLTKAPDDAWEAMASLENDRDFKKVLEWLSGSLTDLDKKSRHTTGETQVWQQGARQALEEILDAAAGAPQTFQKIKELRRNRA